MYNHFILSYLVIILVIFSSKKSVSQTQYYEIGFEIQDTSGTTIKNESYNIFSENYYDKYFLTNEYWIHYEHSFPEEYGEFSDYSRVYIGEKQNGRLFQKRNSYRNPPFQEYYVDKTKYELIKTGRSKVIKGYNATEYMVKHENSIIVLKCFIIETIQYTDYLKLYPNNKFPGYIIQYEAKGQNGNIYNILRNPKPINFSELYFAELNELSKQINPNLTQTLLGDTLHQNIINNINRTFTPIEYYKEKLFGYEKVPLQNLTFDIAYQLRNGNLSRVIYFDEFENEAYELIYSKKGSILIEYIHSAIPPKTYDPKVTIILDSLNYYNKNQYKIIEFDTINRMKYITINDSTKSIKFFNKYGLITKSHYVKNTDTTQTINYSYVENKLKTLKREFTTSFSYNESDLIKEVTSSRYSNKFNYLKDFSFPIDTIKVEKTNSLTKDVDEYLFEFDNNFNLRSIKRSSQYATTLEYNYINYLPITKSKLCINASKQLIKNYLNAFAISDINSKNLDTSDKTNTNSASKFPLLNLLHQDSYKKYFKHLKTIPNIKIDKLDLVYENENDEFYKIEFTEKHIGILDINKGDLTQILSIFNNNNIETVLIDNNNWRIEIASKSIFKIAKKNKLNNNWTFND